METENPDHSDFVKLRSMLVSHMQDLREVTHDVHYENYRSQRLAGGVSPKYVDSLRDNISVVSSEADSHDKDRILAEKEAELRKMQERLARMQEELRQNQINNLDSISVNSNGHV